MSKKSAKTRVLVTGGAGFIGSNIAKTLLKRGFEVVVLDNLSRGSRKAIPAGARFVHGDIRVRKDIERAMKGVSYVIHCAALLVIPDSFKDPGRFFEVNVLGTINLLEVMTKMGVRNLVFSSSAGVYAEKNESPIHEDDKKFPYSPYGDSKLAMEHVMHSYHLANKMNITILRYFNPYGPGYNVTPAEHVVPVFFEKALKNEAFPVYGKGDMQRDYIYIDDLVDVHLLTMKQPGFNIYNVGGGKGTKIIELVKAIVKVTKSKSPINHVVTPKGYPQKMYANISKIRKELGWKPKVGINEGIKLTYDKWYKARLKIKD